MCEYVFRNGKKCQEPAIEGSTFCVLHTPLPEDADSEEFRQLKRLKEEKAQEKVDAGDFNFEGARFDSFWIPIRTEGDVNFNDSRFRGDLWFIDAVIRGDVWFNGVKIDRNAWFKGMKIGRDAWYDGVIINGDARFDGAEIGRHVFFIYAHFGGDAWFEGVKISGDASFCSAEIGGDAQFNDMVISRNAWFQDLKIKEWAWFRGLKVGENAWFDGVEISRNAAFQGAEIGEDGYFRDLNVGENAWFDNVKINGDIWLQGAEIGNDAEFKSARFSGEIILIPINVKGQVSFKDCKFSDPRAQEEACRVAKNQCIRFGDNHEADHYFYREMEGKRRQKLEIFRWPEFIFVQGIFGYGVKPFRTFCIWLGVILSFALIFSNVHALDSGSNFIEYFYFSTTNAMTPGYGGYTVLPEWQWLALIEAFFGTFMWAAFITIFARKYMR